MDGGRWEQKREIIGVPVGEESGGEGARNLVTGGHGYGKQWVR